MNDTSDNEQISEVPRIQKEESQKNGSFIVLLPKRLSNSLSVLQKEFSNQGHK